MYRKFTFWDLRQEIVSSDILVSSKMRKHMSASIVVNLKFPKCYPAILHLQVGISYKSFNFVFVGRVS